MNELTLTLADALGFLNTLVASVVVILAFSLLAYTLTYNFRHPVARRFAFLLGLVMVTYASEVALTQVVGADSASKWLHFEWLGIALLPRSLLRVFVCCSANDELPYGPPQIDQYRDRRSFGG